MGYFRQTININQMKQTKVERFIVESLRQDSLMLFNLKIAQIVSIIMIIIGIFIQIKGRRKKIDK